MNCPHFIPKKYCFALSSHCGICCYKCRHALECTWFRCPGFMMKTKIDDLNIAEKLELIIGKYNIKNTHVSVEVQRVRKKYMKEVRHAKEDPLLGDPK